MFLLSFNTAQTTHADVDAGVVFLIHQLVYYVLNFQNALKRQKFRERGIHIFLCTIVSRLRERRIRKSVKVINKIAPLDVDLTIIIIG